MAQIRETQSRDTVIAVCRAVVLFLDTKTHVWKEVVQVGGISKVQLLQHFTSNSYRIFGRLEKNEQVTIDIVLKQNIEYITSDDTDHASHQIRVSPQTIYLLQLSQDSDGKRFAIVVQRSLQLIKDSPQSLRDAWMTSNVTQPTTRDSRGNLSIRIPPVPKHSDRTTEYNFVGASSLSSRPGTPGTPRQNLEENIEPLCAELSRAINEGDVVGASEIAAHLANTAVLLSIKLKNPKVVIVDSGMGSFSLKVVVEDRETTGGVFAMKVTSKTKIETLQEEVAVRYGFPPKVQRWVIGKKMSKPKDTLADCHVWQGGNTAYLYLMSGRSVGLKRHEFEKYRRKSLEANTPTSLQHHDGWILEPGSTATSPALAGNTSPLSRTVSMPILPTNDQPMDRSASSATLGPSGRVSVGFSGMGLPRHREEQMRSSMHISDIEEVLSASSTRLNTSPFQEEIPLRNEGGMIPVEDVEEEAQGWRCNTCTFINVPTRPGCEICGADRPADYIVPQNIDIQEQERTRLEAERRQTELFQQAWTQRQDPMDPRLGREVTD